MAGSLNGKTGEWLRYIGGLLLAGLVAYFTAQNATDVRLTKVESDVSWIRASMGRVESRLDERDKEERQRFADWLNGVDRRTNEPLPLQKAIEHGR